MRRYTLVHLRLTMSAGCIQDSFATMQPDANDYACVQGNPRTHSKAVCNQKHKKTHHGCGLDSYFIRRLSADNMRAPHVIALVSFRAGYAITPLLFWADGPFVEIAGVWRLIGAVCS